MAVKFYEKYVLISRPRYDERLGVWFTHASIFRDDDKFLYYQLKNLGKTFETEKEALAFGFSAARLWLDEHKLD
jgi:hypothetical protein